MSSTETRVARSSAGHPPNGTREIRTFSLGLAAILGGAGGFQAWKGHPAAAGILLAIAGLSLLFGLAFPGAMRPVHRFFLKLGYSLGWFNTRLILGAIFFLVITPVGLVMRLAGRDPLQRRFLPGSAGYWIRRLPEERGPERYRKMY